VPRGKAIWNANGGFVSVLLTHLFCLSYLFVVFLWSYVPQCCAYLCRTADFKL